MTHIYQLVEFGLLKFIDHEIVFREQEFENTTIRFSECGDAYLAVIKGSEGLQNCARPHLNVHLVRFDRIWRDKGCWDRDRHRGVKVGKVRTVDEKCA